MSATKDNLRTPSDALVGTSKDVSEAAARRGDDIAREGDALAVEKQMEIGTVVHEAGEGLDAARPGNSGVDASRMTRQQELLQGDPEELRARYENLLKTDVEMQSGYSDVKRRRIERHISPLLKVRIDLLRAAEHLPTIEEAFPALRQFVDKDAIDPTEILKAFAAGTMSSEEIRAAGQSLSAPDDLTDEEHDAFIAACEELATETGYEVFEYDFDLLEAEENPTLILRRNGLIFDITLGLAPGDGSIVPGSHISSIVTRRQLHFLPKVVQKYVNASVNQTLSAFEEGRWPIATYGVEIQREIDRVVAIFS